MSLTGPLADWCLTIVGRAVRWLTVRSTVPSRVALVVCLAIVSLATSVRPIAAQETRTSNTAANDGADRWDQFTLFHFLFQQRGLDSLTQIGDFDDRPEQTVVVLIGDLQTVSPRITDGLSDFVRAGGAALIASDRTSSRPRISRIVGGRCRVPEANAYRGFTDCPEIDTSESDWHPLFADVKTLVFNRPGYIRSFGFPFRNSFLLSLPRFTQFNGERYEGLPLMATGQSKGRVLTIADHSLFINSMLPHADNGSFAINVVNWLSESNRQRILFLVDGEVISSNLSETLPNELPPLDALPDIPQETVFGLANAFLSEMQQENILNKLIANLQRSMLDYQIRRVILIALGGIILLFLFSRVFRSQPTVALPGTPLKETVFELRHRGKVSAAVLRPTAETLAKETMKSISDSENPVNWDARTNTFHISGGSFFFRRDIKKMLRELSDFANGTGPSIVSPRALRRLDRSIKIVTTLHAEGRLWRAQ